MDLSDLTVPDGVSLRAGNREDAAAVAALVNHLDDHDDTGERLDAGQLLEIWDVPGFDPTQDLLLAEDDQGTLLGFAEVHRPSEPLKGETIVHLDGGVEPEARGRGIGTALVRWQVARGRDRVAAERPDAAGVISAWGVREHCDATELLVAEGFSVQRWFTDMRLELATWEEPSAVAPLPSAVRAARWPADAAALRSARNESFQDHWSTPPTSEDRWMALFGKSTFRPELSRLLEDPDVPGEESVDAFVLSEEWQEGELYVALVGTRRRARGKGLATALLTDVVRAARAAGYHAVELGVDADSPTGAGGVYERVGFRPVRTGVQLHLR